MCFWKVEGLDADFNGVSFNVIDWPQIHDEGAERDRKRLDAVLPAIF